MMAAWPAPPTNICINNYEKVSRENRLHVNIKHSTDSINIDGWENILKHNSSELQMLASTSKTRKDNLQEMENSAKQK